MEFETENHGYDIYKDEWKVTLGEKLSYAKDTRTECTGYAENAIGVYLGGCEGKPA